MRETLAIHGGNKVRRTPMPARLAFGPEERAMLMEAVEHYAALGEDPPYQGLFESRFCEAFAAYMGGGFADAVCSGTAAVHVALAALDLPKGSEVIISPVTDSGPLNCILLQGYTPVVADSAPGSYNMGVEQFLERATSRTSGLLAVHSAGEPLAMGPIMAEAERRGVKVLEDCSQAPGARWEGQLVGTFGHIAAFSTMYRKTLTAGASGGLVWSPDQETYRLALAHADRGKPAWRKDIDLRNPGFALFPALNFNTDELSCAIGIASLRRLDQAVEARRSFLRTLIKLMRERCVMCRPYAFHDGFSPFYFPVFVDQSRISCTKTEFALAVAAEGIGLGEHYGCLVSEWAFAQPNLGGLTTPNAAATRNASFNLYVNERYGEQEARDVVEALCKVERWYARETAA